MSSTSDQPAVRLQPAPRLLFPAPVDSNSPAFWDGDRLYVFNSTGHPHRSSGPSVFDLGGTMPVTFHNQVNGGRWLEAVWRADDGTLYGWYHLEPTGLCPGTSLTAPQIGALRSRDNGATWTDVGIVLNSSVPLRCDAQNGYFAGGHGDFCVMLDPAGEYLYVLLGNYAGSVADQGVAVARMAWRDRDDPVGKVWKWHRGAWNEPGLGGAVTPIFPAFTAWESANCNAFWGPSVHWNTHLERYVMLLNRAAGAGWVQEGIYVSLARDLSEPESWSPPAKILDGGRWYPQVMGIGEDVRGTDKLAGRVARFFMSGESEYEIVFDQAPRGGPTE